MTSRSRVFAHIVLYHSADSVITAVESLCAQEGFTPQSLQIEIRDNASADGVLERVAAHFGDRITCFRNEQNLGFSGGQNQGAYRFLKSECDYFLVFNPDVRLVPTALKAMVAAFEEATAIGMVTPLLYRSDDSLQPVSPAMIDAAGMFITPAIRHLDRGSGETEQVNFHTPGYMFGGSGACLLLKRSCVEDLLVDTPAEDEALFRIYPQLKQGGQERAALFDEAFFAYREDADLAWRAQILGWKTRFTPEARGYHRRVVVPERRKDLPPEFNLYSVRNRFLLQMNNLSWAGHRAIILQGVIIRNAAVILAVLLRERSSLDALRHVFLLRYRAAARWRKVDSRRRTSPAEVARWFQPHPHIDPCQTHSSTAN